MVNNSNVTMCLVGLCWLLVVAVFEDELRHVGSIPGVGRLLGWVTSRSMTIYLWHTSAMCMTFTLVGSPSSVSAMAVMGGVFVLLLVSVVTLARPLESLDSRQRGVRNGSRRLHTVAHLVPWTVVVVVLTGQPSLFPAAAGSFQPPPP